MGNFKNLRSRLSGMHVFRQLFHPPSPALAKGFSSYCYGHPPRASTQPSVATHRNPYHSPASASLRAIATPLSAQRYTHLRTQARPNANCADRILARPGGSSGAPKAQKFGCEAHWDLARLIACAVRHLRSTSYETTYLTGNGLVKPLGPRAAR